MKKIFLFAFVLTTTLSHAGIPVTCVSDETIGKVPVLKFKINQKVGHEDTRGNVWKHHLIGVTPAEGIKVITYGAGDVTETNIGLTFIDKDYIQGKVLATFDKVTGIYIGKANIDEVEHGRSFNVKCVETEKIKSIE